MRDDVNAVEMVWLGEVKKLVLEQELDGREESCDIYLGGHKLRGWYRGLLG